MIRLSFANSDKAVIAKLSSVFPRLVEALRLKLQYLDTLMLQRVQQKLSGEVLQNRTGVLFGSAHADPVEVSGTVITGGVSAGGGPAFYGKFQETGVPHSWVILPKNKKALAFFPSDSSIAGRTQAQQIMADITKGGARRFGRGVSAFENVGGVVVKKVVHPGLKQRSFMQTTQEEMTEQIYTELIDTVKMVVQG